MVTIGEIKVVTLNNLYVNLESKDTRDYFTGMMLMRTRGWSPEYPENYLPFDASDFVGRHHLFCVERDGRFLPFAGFRQVPLEICDFYKIKEAHLGLVEKANSSPHVEALNSLFNECRKNKTTLISGSKVTISSAFRGNKQLSEHVRELIAALLVLDSQEGTQTIQLGSGVFRFKTDQFLDRMGFKPLTLGNTELPPVQIPEAGSEPILIMTNHEYSDWAKSCVEKHCEELNRRVILDEMPAVGKIAA